MRILILFLLTCLSLSAAAPPVVRAKNLTSYGLVSSMSSTDYFAIEVNGNPQGIKNTNVIGLVLNQVVGTNAFVQGTNNVATNAAAYANLAASNRVTVAASTGITVTTNGSGGVETYTVSSSVTTNGLATTNYVNSATNGLVTQSVTNGLATTNYVNTATNGLVTASVTNGLATTNYVNSATNTLSSYVDKASSNRVTVAAGANVTVTTNGSGGVETYTVAANSTTIHSEFDNILITNAFNRIISRVASTVTTQQIDVVAGPSVYYWPTVNSNIVCQFTNMWTSQVSNRVIDFFFNGGAADKTVTFVCPNPGGVAFRWGVFSATNGATTFTITNGHTGSASTSPFDTNVIEGFYSPGI